MRDGGKEGRSLSAICGRGENAKIDASGVYRGT